MEPKITLDMVTMRHLIESWIPLQEVQLQEKSVVGIIDLFVDDLCGTGGTEMEEPSQDKEFVG